MRATQSDNQIERRILIGMIVSDNYLRDVQTIYDPNLIMIPFVRIVAKWCFDFYKRYQKAPGIHIEDIFTGKKSKLGEDQTELIAGFLESISHEYEHSEHFNVEYLLAQTEERFEGQNQILLAEELKIYSAKGEINKGKHAISTYRSIQKPSTAGINPYTDEKKIRAAFEDDAKEILFQFPGALGKLLGAVYRDDFISVMGKPKMGKTWWLQEISDRGFRSRCNVVLFECGDMSEKKMLKRIAVRNTGKNWNTKYCGEFLCPVLDCFYNQSDECTMCQRTGRGVVGANVKEAGNEMWVEFPYEQASYHIPCTYCLRERTGNFKGAVWHKPITIQKVSAQDAIDAGNRIAEKTQRCFKLFTFPNRSINVKNIEMQLDILEDVEGFIADLVIIDYADILAPERELQNERQQINETWMALRALGQKKHCAIIAATQADAKSWDMFLLRESNFSEDRRKYDHVTRVITLNQLSSEKKRGIMRIGTMFVREEDFNTLETVTVLQCLQVGRPYLGSF